MANETMTLIASSTVGAGGTGTIDFNSIPQTYTDLMLVHSSRLSTSLAGTYTYLRFNGNTSATYSYKNLNGSGTAANTNALSNQTELALTIISDASTTSNTFASQQIYIPNYAGSTNKSVSSDGVSENNATGAFQIISAGIWANTSAITSISLFYNSLTYAQYTTASLYGILKGSGGATVS